MKKRKFGDGGSVRASQSDVRKTDKVATKNMPSEERRRLLMSRDLPTGDHAKKGRGGFDPSGANDVRMGMGQLQHNVGASIDDGQPHRRKFVDGTVDDVEEQGKRISRGLEKFNKYEHQYKKGGQVKKYNSGGSVKIEDYHNPIPARMRTAPLEGRVKRTVVEVEKPKKPEPKAETKAFASGGTVRGTGAAKRGKGFKGCY